MTRENGITPQLQIEALAAAFARDADRFSPDEMAHQMRKIKTNASIDARALLTPADAARWLGAVGFVASCGVRGVLSQLRDGDSRVHRLMDDAIFALEDVAMAAYHVLRTVASQDGALDAPSGGVSSSSSSSGSSGVDAALVRGALSRVLAYARAWPPLFVLWCDVALLLALCWLRRDANTAEPFCVDLLDAVVAECRENKSMERHAVWPLFVLGLVFAVVRRDDIAGLRCMEDAVALAQCTNVGVGVLHYWYAVLLGRNQHHTAAIEQLRLAVAADTAVVSSLNLHALLALQANDQLEAAEALERCVDLDLDDAASMFNYAVLLEAMGNRQAQFQMLELFSEAAAATVRDDDETKEREPTRKKENPKETATASSALRLFTDEELTGRLFACKRAAVVPGEVELAMAMAAMACGAWQDSRLKFEAFFSSTREATNGRGSDETTMRSYIYVLLQCNRPTQALEQCELALLRSRDDLVVHLYKADALLSLERVDECLSELTREIEPRLASLLDDAAIQQLHVQLLNNLAVVSVCCGDVDRAVDLLRDCAKRYPATLSVKFNLTLLLWRLERRDAACALWFETRGWSLRMDVGSMRDQQDALAFVARVEDQALCSATQPKILSHVVDAAATGSGGVEEHQLRYLDALVLNYWANAQSAAVAQTTAQYVEYLETVAARVANMTPPSTRTPSSKAPSAMESRHAVVERWWHSVHRSILAQLVCSLLMQVSYIAFPAYNFALALWCLACCTPKWFAKNARLTLLVLGAVSFSLVTDIIWISLWVSGRVFYEQLCGQNGVSIVSCGGASDYYPGCTTNRFALLAMLLNDAAKLASIVCIHRIRALQLGDKKHGGGDDEAAPITAAPVRPGDLSLPPVPAPPASASSRVVASPSVHAAGESNRSGHEKEYR